MFRKIPLRIFLHSNNAPAQSVGPRENIGSGIWSILRCLLRGTAVSHGRRISGRTKACNEGARLLFVFFLRLRKNERTGCSVEKAIAAEGKRWVAVLIVEAWRLYLLMRQRAVPYQGKPKSVVAIEGSRVQRRILARSGPARYSAPSVK